MICRYKQYVYLNTILNFWFIIKTTSKVVPLWNFDLRIFSVYGRGARCAIGLLLIFLISILAVYTSNGRQRTAEEDLQDFLGKGTSEADRINSPLSRLWLKPYLLPILALEIILFMLLTVKQLAAKWTKNTRLLF